jgi:hypothetical protein
MVISPPIATRLRLSIYPSIYLSIHFTLCLSVYLSVSVSLSLCTYGVEVLACCFLLCAHVLLVDCEIGNNILY